MGRKQQKQRQQPATATGVAPSVVVDEPTSADAQSAAGDPPPPFTLVEFDQRCTAQDAKRFARRSFSIWLVAPDRIEIGTVRNLRHMDLETDTPRARRRVVGDVKLDMEAAGRAQALPPPWKFKVQEFEVTPCKGPQPRVISD